MSEREALLRAVTETPQDDSPRLVYADYLEENGESLWAELIRVQCELHKRRDEYDSYDLMQRGPAYKALAARENALVGQVSHLLGGWGVEGHVADVPGAPAGVRFERGFVADMSLPCSDFMRLLGEGFFRSQPLVGYVHLNDRHPNESFGCDKGPFFNADSYDWWEEANPPRDRVDIAPPPVFEALLAVAAVDPDRYYCNTFGATRFVECSSREAAIDLLDAAALHVVKVSVSDLVTLHTQGEMIREQQ